MTPAAPQQRLSPAAAARLDRLSVEAAGLQALAELAALIGGQRWHVAGEIAGRLRRFEATSWPRLRAGARQPRNRIEVLLADMAASGLPRSQRKLFDLLA